MARPSPDRRDTDPDIELADDPDVELADDLDADAADDVDSGVADATDIDAERDPQTEELWASTRIDPIEVALPIGSGYTLRSYRATVELRGTDLDRDDEGSDTADRDDETGDARRRSAASRDAEDVDADTDAAGDPDDEHPDEDEDHDDEDHDDEHHEDEDENDDHDDENDDHDEVPVFLGHEGNLYLFRTPESLVDFVRSDAPHDLTQLDTWADLVERIRVEDVAPTAEDTYELDLVVENLRGGHDAWDAQLLIGAGEFARDVGYAMRAAPILTALGPGSPLDDLDEALRGSIAGGLGAFFARRRLRKIGAQQATLGWRTIIGKISGLVVWRD